MHSSTNLARGYGFKAAAIMLAIVAAAFFAPGITQAHATTKSTVALSATAKTATVTGSLNFSGTTSTCKDIIPLSPSYKGRISINFKATNLGTPDWVSYEDVNPTIGLYESTAAPTAIESKGLYGCASSSGLNFEPTAMVPSWMDAEMSGKTACIKVGCNSTTSNKNRSFDYTLTITYTPYADVTIKYLNKADNSELVTSETVTVPMGVSYKATAKSVGNYTVDSSAKSITPGSSSNTITFYYTKNAASGEAGETPYGWSNFYDYSNTFYVTNTTWHGLTTYDYSGYFMGSEQNEDVPIELQLNGTTVKTFHPSSTGTYKLSYSNAKLKPGTSYTLKLVAKKAGLDDYVIAQTKTTTMSFGKATCKATKINTNQAVVRAVIPAYMAKSGEVKIKIFKASKLIKSFTSSSNKCEYKYVCKKKGAGKAKYKVVLESNVSGIAGKSISNAVKCKANKRTVGSVSPITYYSMYNGYFIITKISYSSSKRLSVTGYFVNRHIYTTKFKSDVVVRVDGKKIASKTVSSGSMGMNTKRKVTFSMSAKAGADLANGNLVIDHKPYQY